MLKGFQEALKEHEEQLVKDPVVHTHLSALYDTLLEQNLIRLIEPFSCVQILHLAELINLPLETVLNKLAQVLFSLHACAVGQHAIAAWIIVFTFVHKVTLLQSGNRVICLSS